MSPTNCGLQLLANINQTGINSAFSGDYFHPRISHTWLSGEHLLHCMFLRINKQKHSAQVYNLKKQKATQCNSLLYQCVNKMQCIRRLQHRLANRIIPLLCLDYSYSLT